MVLDVEGFLEYVGQSRVLLLDCMWDHRKIQAVSNQLLQIRLAPTQPHRVQMWITFFTIVFYPLLWNWPFIVDACQHLVPVPTPHRAAVHCVDVLVYSIMLARLAQVDVINRVDLVQRVFIECDGFVGPTFLK